MEVLYPHLRRLAAHQLAEGGRDLSLRPTELVHEAYLRLVDQRQANWRNRGHFFAVSARLMRRLIIDHARRTRRQKRGGGVVHVPLEDLELVSVAPSSRLLALDAALERLAEIDPTAAQLVDLRYFIGLSIDDAAKALELGRSTAVRRWRYAKAWLGRELDNAEPAESP
jgi:RNA polymerase sigma factor (TIGR02999 family)